MGPGGIGDLAGVHPKNPGPRRPENQCFSAPVLESCDDMFFGRIFDSKLPQNWPRISQKIMKPGLNSGPHFFELWALSWLLLGELLGLFELSWETSTANKCRQSDAKTIALNIDFFVFWGSSWPSWAHLGASWASLEPRMDLQITPKSTHMWPPN